jgi:hypothetical protein
MSLDLNKLENNLDEALIKETTETLTKFLNDKRMTNNKQQTAVEFYLDKVFDIIGDAILDKLSIEQINKIHDLSLQAKEMEKEQKANTWNNAINAVEKDKWESFDQYYNETYGGGEQ